MKHFTINQTDITSWVMDGAPYEEAKIPVLEGPTSDGWEAMTTMHLNGNKTVDLVMAIAGDSMDTVSQTAFSLLLLRRLLSAIPLHHAFRIFGVSCLGYVNICAYHLVISHPK